MRALYRRRVRNKDKGRRDDSDKEFVQLIKAGPQWAEVEKLMVVSDE